jgi:hypothetical protein
MIQDLVQRIREEKAHKLFQRDLNDFITKFLLQPVGKKTRSKK